jgi:hypothetical protein
VAPDATVHVLAAPPVVGAAVIGLERLTAPLAAHRRVRAGLTDARITAKTAAGRDRSWARRREES